MFSYDFSNTQAQTAEAFGLATGEQEWHLVDRLSSSRSSRKEMVLALTFIECPHPLPPALSSSAAIDIFLAAASSNGTIKIWCGPPFPHASAGSSSSPTDNARRGAAGRLLLLPL